MRFLRRFVIFTWHSTSRNPMDRASLPPHEEPAWRLRPTDQAAVAILVGLALAATVAWWVQQGGLRGRLVETDQAKPQSARFQVDVNTAAWPELAEMPGVGQTLAQRIVNSRQQDGPFRDEHDLLRVSGIGAKTLAALHPYLRPFPNPQSGDNREVGIIGGK